MVIGALVDPSERRGKSLKALNWGGLGSSVAASRLITRQEAFTLTVHGDAAGALRTVAAPGAKLDRQMLSQVAGSFSLTTLPAVMLYALGRHYQIGYDNLGEGGIRIRFELGKPTVAPDAGESKPS